jgi:hypothetical protein
MKNLLKAIALVLLSCSSSMAQEEREVIPVLNKESKEYEYKSVRDFNGAEVPVKTASERALKYVYRTLQTSKDKVVVDDANNEIIFDCSLKAEMVSGFGYAVNTAAYVFKVNLQFKEGKYRILANDFLYSFLMNDGAGQKYYSLDLSKIKNNKSGKKIKGDLSDLLYQMSTDLDNAIAGKASSSKEDW